MTTKSLQERADEISAAAVIKPFPSLVSERELSDIALRHLQEVEREAVERTWHEAADRLMETARQYGAYKYSVSGSREGNVSRLFVLENDWMRERAQQAHKEQG